MDNLFLSNIKKIRYHAPLMAARLPYAGSGNIKVCKTKRGELNFCVEGRDFHSQEGAFKEAQQQILALDLSDTYILCVYGIGAGHYYYAVKKWLREDPTRVLVFIEDDISVVRCFAETKQGYEILHDKQVQLRFWQENLKEKSMDLAWDFLLLKVKITALKYYAKEKKEKFELIKKNINCSINNVNSNVLDLLKFDLYHYENILKNFFVLDGARNGAFLTDRFKNMPMILCGSGPSLRKNISSLRRLQDKALIVAGGSAINVCGKYSIKPHMTVGIDPDDKEYRFFLFNDVFETPLLYRNRLNKKALKINSGERVFFNGVSGHLLASWFENFLGIGGKEIPGSLSVTTTALNLAVFMGCNPIILNGVDLSFVDNEHYSCIVDFFGPSVTENKDLNNNFSWDDNAFAQNVRGKEITTKNKWLVEANWCSNFVKKNPGITFINTSQEGLDIENMTNMPLEEVEKTYCNKNINISDLVHAEVQSLPKIRVKDRDIHKAIKAFRASLKNSVDIIGKITANPLSSYLFELELEEEPAYKYLLDQYSDVYHSLSSRIMYNCLERDDYGDLCIKINVLLELEKKAKEHLSVEIDNE